MSSLADDPLRRLVHDLANPLSTILAETQLLLYDADKLGPEIAESLKEIERSARKMRDLLQKT